MKLLRADCVVARTRNFRCWREIIEAVQERRERLTRVLEERRVWREIQNNIGMEE